MNCELDTSCKLAPAGIGDLESLLILIDLGGGCEKMKKKCENIWLIEKMLLPLSLEI